MTDDEKVLFTGGGGLLGREFQKILPGALYPSKREFDVTDPDRMETYVAGRKIGTILHAAAFTSPPKVDQNPVLAIDANIIGTSNIVKLCVKHSFRLVYVSTDYVFRGDSGDYNEEDALHPVNKYAWSKLGGECAVRMYEKSVIVRTSFGPNEFPYDKAFVNQWTSRESVSVVARMILKVVESDFQGTLHVGGDRKTVYEYAVSLSPDKKIGKLSTDEVKFLVPKDTSLNTSLYKTLFGKRNS
ncbi:MAG TPA: sugar nucleotide-binding protein [Candidatus Kryptonia bacterium]